MATKKKMLQAAAGSATGGGALDITDVFSTYLYEGNGSTQTITNDIDLAGEGGLVWLKGRNNGNSHYLHDSERTITKWLQSQATTAEQTNGPVTSFNSNGFSLGYGQGNGGANSSGDTFASWTFRKAPKFFDVVTYTGTGSKRTVSHNLGSTPGMIVIKRTDGSGSDGDVWHRSLGSDGSVNQYYVQLSTDYVASLTSRFGIYGTDDPNDTTFTVKNQSGVNASGATYVAYLFAHNNGDGEFGPDGDQDIIKCGSYTGAGTVDLGFEPQWVLFKRTESSGPWYLQDTMRGLAVDGSDQAFFYPNNSSAEAVGTGDLITPTSTGFNHINAGNYIYIAIRRGPLAPPESATEVFAPYLLTAIQSPMAVLGSPVDMTIHKYNINSSTQKVGISSRLTAGKYMFTNTTDAEATSGLAVPASDATAYAYQTGVGNGVSLGFGDDYTWMWKRAPGYFDVVAYTGDGTGDRKLLHNLGVAPEMVWLKPRSTGDSYSGKWFMWHNTFGHAQSNAHLHLNTTDSLSSSTGANPVHSFDADGISPNIRGGGIGEHNKTGVDYIVYLFASLPGISKVGSYSGNGSGSGQNIDCGFTTGARFIVLKQVNNTSNWLVFDTVRGITVGNDPYIKLDVTDAETTNPIVDPYSSGFKLQSTIFNASGDDYIFYAIA